MSVLFTVLTILVLVASVLITLIVLLQNGKGGGLASNFVAGNQTFGVRQTADILEKITWGLVAFIFVVSVVTTFTLSSGKVEKDYSDNMKTEEATLDASAERPDLTNTAEVTVTDKTATETTAETTAETTQGE